MMNMTNQQYRVKGAFFENLKETGPAFTGFVEIDGVRTNISLWPKTSQKGLNYFQVSEDKKGMKPASQQAPSRLMPPRTHPTSPSPSRPVPTIYKRDMDDDIPF